MNFSSLKEYLVNGLDPSPDDSINVPFMQTLTNWVPAPTGLKSATKLSTAGTITTLTGYGLTPFGDVKTSSTYDTTVTVNGASTVYSNSHARCCTAKGMIFFAKPKSDIVQTDFSKALYTPGASNVFWCGPFNEGLGLALGLNNDTQLHLMSGEDGVDHFNKYACGYIQLPGTVHGLHEMGPNVVVCTQDGLYLLEPANFERFTFGHTKLSSDVCTTPMTITGGIPVVVNAAGELLILQQDGIQKLGYSKFLYGKTITRVTKHSYKESYYICLNESSPLVYILNQSGLYAMAQTVGAKTDNLEACTTVSSLGAAVAETMPFNLGIEGMKNIKGVVINCSTDVTVSIGYKKSRDDTAFSYTSDVVASPDSRGVINMVVSGYEFTVKVTGADAASTWISDLGVLSTDAVKTNFSRISRRV